MTLDLSAVTDSLIGLVKSQWTTAPIWTEIGGSPPGPTFTPNFTGLAPDAARQEPGPQLSMYLYHVESDNAQEALFWQPQMLDAPAGEPTGFLPLALDLFYLLFAYSETSYTEEQEAMSVALRIFHANPIVRSDPGAAVALGADPHHGAPLLRRAEPLVAGDDRTAADVPGVPRGRGVHRTGSDAGARAGDLVVLGGRRPCPLPSRPGPGGFPAVFGTFRDGSYAGPTGPAVPFSQSPATVAAGQTAWLMGSDLGVSGVSDSVYLLPPSGGAEVDVTAWAVAAESSAAKFVLTLPPAVGAAAGRRSGPGRLPAPRRRRHAGLARRHADRLGPRQRRRVRGPGGRAGTGGIGAVHGERGRLHPGCNGGARRHRGADRGRCAPRARARSASTRPARRSLSRRQRGRPGRSRRCGSG